VRERFAYFRTIGAANDAFLQRLAGLQERLNGPGFFGANMAASEAEALNAHVRSMVESLVAMTGARYENLRERYEVIHREIAGQIPKLYPAGAGPMIVWPTDPAALQPEIVGPKAARLAEVKLNAGLRVPPFFSISVYAYRLFMEASGIQEIVRGMLGSLDIRKSGSVKSFSDAVCRAFAEACLPPALESELLEGYRRLVALQPGTGVAVRSSAVVEDSESSFAGQFESILNVREEELAKAYKEVVASKYRHEALKYAIARGYLDEDVAMPVLIMTMVQPVASGVAFSRCPDRPDSALITAVPGLAQAADTGRVIPDTFFISVEPPVRVERLPGKWDFSLRCAAGGGLMEWNEAAATTGAPALSEEQVLRVARAACALEQHFGSPQDVEWALDEADTLVVVQARPLHSVSSRVPAASNHVVEGYRILVRGVRASGGTVSGPVYHLLDLQAAERVPEDAILCVPTTSPRLAGVMEHVRGIIAAAGSPTGHMATVAREFGIPCIVGAENAHLALPPGTIVTLDADAGIVYEGKVREQLPPESQADALSKRPNPGREDLQKLLDLVAPLTLSEPDSPEFLPSNCRTFHDIARYVHQKSMMEMFDLEELSAQERRAAHRLLWRAPMEMLLLDLGGGIAEGAERSVPVDQIKSTALSALLEGMTDPRLRWAGPVGFDLKGFMSVVVRSAADDQRYGEPIYCVCSKDYVHFASRLAYHFATVDALCGQLVNENYARFLFFGGAAIASRREWRAHLLATVLDCNGFAVRQEGDRVEAILAKRHAEQIEEALVMLGRLMVASRHLDMVIESRAAAQALAQAFLSGDYAFERVRGIGI
jgi:pyruvate,water dikinase